MQDYRPGEDRTHATQLRNGAKVYANLSRYHPDYGMTVREHALAKEMRARGETPFVDKEQRRARLKPLADRAVANERGRR